MSFIYKSLLYRIDSRELYIHVKGGNRFSPQISIKAFFSFLSSKSSCKLKTHATRFAALKNWKQILFNIFYSFEKIYFFVCGYTKFGYPGYFNTFFCSHLVFENTRILNDDQYCLSNLPLKQKGIFFILACLTCS
jgi:hypothetical protein